MQISNWLYASAHSKHRIDRPKALTRPGAVDPSPRLGTGRSMNEMRVLLDTWARGQPTEER